nr:RAB7A-interacting MON1-CCZ1 complex subunit 1-like [Lytechinus pictus]
MTKLMELYARPVDLVKKVFGDFSLPMDILGKDYVECLHWRKGALMYMYCNTLYEQTERVRDELTQFMQCLEEGVRHLESMLAVRLPTNKVQIECQVLTEDTLSLIKQGLFSDTHVLALMYAGEMCYWHHTLLQQKKQKEAATLSVMTGGLNHTSQEDISSITKSASSLDIAGDDVWQARHPGNRHSIHVCEGMLLFDSKAVGKRMLQRYVEVVKGPLRFVGWDCARAEELLRLLDAQG